MNEGVRSVKWYMIPREIAIPYVLTEVKRSCEKLLGLKKEDVTGKKASEVYGTKPPYVDIYVLVAETGNSNILKPIFSQWVNIFPYLSSVLE